MSYLISLNRMLLKNIAHVYKALDVDFWHGRGWGIESTLEVLAPVDLKRAHLAHAGIPLPSAFTSISLNFSVP